MGTAQGIVDLLTNPTVESVTALHVGCSIDKAARNFFDAGQVSLAQRVEDHDWLSTVEGEVNRRYCELEELFGSRKITRVVAREIREWGDEQESPVCVNDGAVAVLSQELGRCQEEEKECFSAINALEDEDRFGWDYVKDEEDLEYAAAVSALADARSVVCRLKFELSLAEAGIKERVVT